MGMAADPAIVSGKMAGRHPTSCTELHQARQHLTAEVGQFVEIIDKRERDPPHAGFADAFEFVRHAVGRTDEWIATDRVGREVLPLLGILVGRNRLRSDALVGEHTVDRAPIRILDDGVAVVVLRLLLARPTDYLANGVDLDLATDVLRRALDLGDLLRVALERGSRPRCRYKERIAIAQRESLTDFRRARVHDDRPVSP